MIVRGSTAPGFGAIADAFAQVMAGSAGAFSVVRGGETLVELYGGRARAADAGPELSGGGDAGTDVDGSAEPGGAGPGRPRDGSGPGGSGGDTACWDRDTVAVLFSGTKGLAAAA